MEVFTQNVNFFTSIGVVIGNFVILAVIALLLIEKFGKDGLKARAESILKMTGRWGIHGAFLVALVATAISLVYSDIIGFVPCELCWIQRIFLYPQVIILGLALWKKTKDSEIYCSALSLIGGVIALYHFYGQSFNPSALPACDALGEASCAARYFVEFGYVTIPLMSLTGFLLILCGIHLKRRLENA